MTDRHIQDEFLASSSNENTHNNTTQHHMKSTSSGHHLATNSSLLQQQQQPQQVNTNNPNSQQINAVSNVNSAHNANSNPTNLQLQQQIHLQQQQMQQQQVQLHTFWQNQVNHIRQINPDTTDFKTHQLPLARIKKIMKTDEDVRMISAEAPVLFAKACELFILELSLRSWIHTEENKRRTLQRNDIATAITKTDMFDFLIDIVPRDDIKTSQNMTAVATAMSFNSMPSGITGTDGKQEHDAKGEGVDNSNEMANIYQQQLQQQQAVLQHMMQQNQNEGVNSVNGNQQWQNQQFGQQYQQLQQMIDSQHQPQHQQSQSGGQGHNDNTKNNNESSGLRDSTNTTEQPTIEV